MELHNLKPAKGSNKKAKKRVGRGEGSGKGGTATRGMNGAASRSGYSHKPGFEGGQMPIQRRLPKFGFKNPFRVEYTAVNVSALQALSEKTGLTEINLDTLVEYGVTKPNELVKVLGNGELTARIDVTADAFSESARQKITAVGGTATTVE